MNNRKDSSLEELIQFFIREVMSSGFPQSAAGKKPEMEDLFQMMREWRERRSGNGGSKGTTIVVTEDQQKNQAETAKMKAELEALKEQILQLKQQLRDKDEIIALLKEKVKKEEAAPQA